MQAILLAAGEGSRLRPFTIDKPKPMIRAANKPILQHAVEALVANGITEITVVLGYQRAKVQAYLGDGVRFGARISYAFQEVQAGTASALAAAPRPRGPFLVLGGDNVVDASLLKAVISAPGDGPAVALHESETPMRYGVVTLDGSRVEEIVEKPDAPRSRWVNTGVYRFPAEFHGRVRAAAERGVAGLTEVLDEAIREGVRVEGVRSSDLWSDAVYPWDLLRVNTDLLRASAPMTQPPPGVTVRGPVLIGEGATIEPGCVLGPGTVVGDDVHVGPHCVLESCVLYEDVQIAPFAYVRNAILGEGTRVGPRLTILSGPASVRQRDGWHDLEEFGAVVGEDCRIGGSVTLLPGSLVGNRVQIAHGKAITGALEDGAVVR